MKKIEVRRHSIREESGDNLSQPGVSLARRVGKSLGKFERVITSNSPRAFQTAIAMGYAVNEEVELLASMSEKADLESPWPTSFGGYSSANRQNGAIKQYTQRLAKYYQELAETLPEGGAARVVNHGGVVELSAVACLTRT